MQMFDLKALLRYLSEGFGVGLASYLIAGQRFTLQEILMIALTAAVTLFVLDQFAPAIGPSARLGAGFGLGLQTVTNAPGLEAFDDQEAVQMGQIPQPAQYNSREAPNKPVSLAAVPTVIPTKITPTPTNVAKAEASGCSAGMILTHYNRNCACGCPCTSTCQPDDKCKINCPDNKPCHLNDCKIGVSGCPYKIIPGNYSHRVLLPGYNECVQPYNTEPVNSTI